MCADLSHLSHSQLHVHSMYLLKLLCMLKLKLLDYVKLSFMTMQKMIIKFNTNDAMIEKCVQNSHLLHPASTGLGVTTIFILNTLCYY